MVEVEVGVDHDVHVGRVEAGVSDPVLEARRIAVVRHAVDLVELLALLVPDPGVDQDQRVGRLDEQTAERQRDAVATVGRNPPLPERLGDDAEHRPPVELLDPGLDPVHADRSDLDAPAERQALVEGHVLLLGVDPKRGRGS